MIYGYFNIQLIKESQYYFNDTGLRLTRAVEQFNDQKIDTLGKMVSLSKVFNEKIEAINLQMTHEQKQTEDGNYNVLESV